MLNYNVKKLIFMDESSFQTKRCGLYVNRKPSSYPKHSGVKQRFCQTVHVWCALSDDGIVCYKVVLKIVLFIIIIKHSLQFFTKALTKEGYCAILDFDLKPHLTNKFNNDYLIIQDNDPKHNSDKVYNYMIANKFKWVIYLLSFYLQIHKYHFLFYFKRPIPAYSPDINIQNFF